MPDSGFHDCLFPPNISLGAKGGPRYRTTVVTSGSGVEQRLPEWDEALMRWTVGKNLYTEGRLDEILAFFHARMGSAYAFRFKDWSDYAVGLKWTMNQPVYDPALRHRFAVAADDGTATYQLKKLYASGPVVRERRITRPVAGTVRIYVDGVERTSGVSVDHATGRVTFASPFPSADSELAWTGAFDVPARFDSDAMEISLGAVRTGDWPSIGIVGVRE